MIPPFDHNQVLPPFVGLNPTDPMNVSPYECTTVEIVNRFALNPERKTILRGFLDFRTKLYQSGLTNGFQWLGGSFMEDIEASQNRKPNDLDLVTVFWDYDTKFQNNLIAQFPEFISSFQSKQSYKLDHYPFDFSFLPENSAKYSAYWIQLFGHTRNKVWKGMLKVPLNTPLEDATALNLLS